MQFEVESYMLYGLFLKDQPMSSVSSCGSAATHCHHSGSLSNKLFRILEKVTAVALGLFAAYANMELFLPFFLVGIATGLYQNYSVGGAHCASAGGGCSQDLLEKLTGVKLPPVISLGASAAVTWCHIDHHTNVFVPIVGLFMGSWTGQAAGDMSRWAVSFF